ncbi:hypothetical protein, partial [Chryseobacterium sp. SIMBA_029]|uniref:hypothetical protein n=1 Tax=Chryseobacterium sp. SIMBA_029 TaxID=3085772 RepID=UPI0039781E18
MRGISHTAPNSFGGSEMSQNYQPGGDTETNNIGALADGFLGNTAINDPDTSDNSTAYIGGLANGDNRDNT